MSYRAGYVNISANVQAELSIQQCGAGYIVVGNESPLTVKISYPGTTVTHTSHATTVDLFPLPEAFNGPIVFSPESYISNASAAPSSVLIIDVYAPNERPDGSYPIALSRLNNVGNQVQTSVTSTNAIDNESNPIGTSILLSKIGGSTYQTLTNDGVWHYNVMSNNVLTEILTILPGDATHAATLQIGSSGLTLEVRGNLLVDNNEQIKSIQGFDGTNRIVLTGYDTVVQAAGSGNVVQLGGSTATLAVGNSGASLKNNGILTFMNNNTIARVGDMGGSTSGTYTHNLGAVPDYIGITTHSLNGSQTVGYDSETASQVHVTAGAGLSWFGWLSKRTV